MNTTHIPTLGQMEDFVSGSLPLDLQCPSKTEAYAYVQQVAISVSYITLGKKTKGIVRAYLEAVTGYSAASLTRLLHQYKKTGVIKPAKRTQPTFTGIYTRQDIVELARIDGIHERLSGPATCNILKREYRLFGNAACVRLQYISPAHLYRLRATTAYRNKVVAYVKTKPANVSIGKRAKPEPDGRPGFIRVDSVHQGDKDGEKGVYHINLVDEVSQWEIVVAVEGISERFMIPALIAALDLFPFKLVNFHADNGSEYINKQVAELLNDMLVKLTKSRPRHSGDNGLVETKNGAVIRKALGYLHIPRTPHNVEAINRWYRAWFIPYLNFHRPCAYRDTKEDSRGKITHRYPSENYMQPYEKFKSLPGAKQYLKPGITFEQLDLQAYAMSDTRWAEAMQEQKAVMWASIKL